MTPLDQVFPHSAQSETVLPIREESLATECGQYLEKVLGGISALDVSVTGLINVT